MGLTCVILQPSYIPWRGYFHQIQKADIFVFYDDVQYDRRGWRNRNRIKSPGGGIWLTIPVRSSGCQIHQIPINRIPICWDRNWTTRHLKSIRTCYASTPFFSTYAPILERVYGKTPKLLTDFTIELTLALAGLLGLDSTRFIRSSELDAGGQKTDRLLAILQGLGASRYISGPSARDYLEEDKLRSVGIELEYMDYCYPEYPQLYPPFDPQVSILDLLFMTGPKAGEFIWG